MEEKHILINIGRQFGAGGKGVADILGKRLGIPVYDNELLQKAAEESGFNPALFRKSDERRRLFRFGSLFGPFSWETTFTGARWSRTANTPDYYIDPWTVSDVSLSRTIALPASGNRAKTPELEAGITVRNLFNHRYQVVQGYPMPGTNLMVSVAYSW